jgi:hypothetical protein
MCICIRGLNLTSTGMEVVEKVNVEVEVRVEGFAGGEAHAV